MAIRTDIKLCKPKGSRDENPCFPIIQFFFMMMYLLDKAVKMDKIGLISTNLAEKIASCVTENPYRIIADIISTACIVICYVLYLLIFDGMKLVNPFLALLLGGNDMVKCTFSVPIGFNIMAGIRLMLFAFGVACLMSLRVKRITPRALLSGE